MSKITLNTIQGSITKLAAAVDNLQKGQEEIKELISTEIHGLAFLVAKTEMKLIDKMDNIEIGLEKKIDDLRKDMNAGFDRIDKTKISYNVPIKVKKSVKSV